MSSQNKNTALAAEKLSIYRRAGGEICHPYGRSPEGWNPRLAVYPDILKILRRATSRTRTENLHFTKVLLYHWAKVAKFYKNIEDSWYCNQIKDLDNIGAKPLLYLWATSANGAGLSQNCYSAIELLRLFSQPLNFVQFDFYPHIVRFNFQHLPETSPGVAVIFLF